MATYFSSAHTKAVLTDDDAFSSKDSRADLLMAQYGLDRRKIMTQELEDQIENLYKKWCDLLLSGYNVVVTGPNSKFALLETFKRRFLDSGKLLDWTSSDSLEPLNITTVRLHGLDPIKMEAFSHAIFHIRETRRVKDTDYQELGKVLKEKKMHYVFLIHSFEYFIENCEEIFEAITKLYTSYPENVHIVMSSDHWNAGLRLKNLQHSLRLVYSRSVLPGIDSFLWEKTELIGDFDHNDARVNDTTVHRLFADKTDLQSLKDIYQALDRATQQILVYIIKDFNDKSESNINSATMSKKRFQGMDAEDDEEHELRDEDRADDIVPMRTRRANNNGTRNNNGAKRQSHAPKTIGTHLDFQHLLKYCESKFIVRRGTALRDHLGELKDHNLVSFEDAGNKIQCLVDVDIGKKFLDWVQVVSLI